MLLNEIVGDDDSTSKTIEVGENPELTEEQFKNLENGDQIKFEGEDGATTNDTVYDFWEESDYYVIETKSEQLINFEKV